MSKTLEELEAEGAALDAANEAASERLAAKLAEMEDLVAQRTASMLRLEELRTRDAKMLATIAHLAESRGITSPDILAHARLVHDNLAKASAEVAERSFKCAARASIDPPQECDWPLCSCDPYANKVVAALQECGALGDDVAHSPLAQSFHPTRNVRATVTTTDDDLHAGCIAQWRADSRRIQDLVDLLAWAMAEHKETVAHCGCKGHPHCPTCRPIRPIIVRYDALFP